MNEKYLFIKYIILGYTILMECEVVTRTFAQGYTKIKKLPKKEILYHWTEDGHAVVLRQNFLFRKDLQMSNYETNFTALES